MSITEYWVFKFCNCSNGVKQCEIKNNCSSFYNYGVNAFLMSKPMSIVDYTLAILDVLFYQPKIWRTFFKFNPHGATIDKNVR